MGINWWLIHSRHCEVRLLTAITALECIMHKLLEAKKCKCHPKQQPPLACRIDLLLNEMKINRNDIEIDKIKEPAVLRNKIVHKSYSPKNEKEDDELWEAIILSREILVRIVFSMLRFEGSYLCYIGGEHMRKFPTCERIGFS